jgi:hypothetical protein
MAKKNDRTPDGNDTIAHQTRIDESELHIIKAMLGELDKVPSPDIIERKYAKLLEGSGFTDRTVHKGDLSHLSGIHDIKVTFHADKHKKHGAIAERLSVELRETDPALRQDYQHTLNQVVSMVAGTTSSRITHGGKFRIVKDYEDVEFKHRRDWYPSAEFKVGLALHQPDENINPEAMISYHPSERGRIISILKKRRNTLEANDRGPGVQ